MSEVGQKNQPKKPDLFLPPFIYTISSKKGPLSPWRIIPLPHNDIITQIQTLVQDTRHISLILSLFIKWTVVQNVNMMSEHNMSLCHNATFLFMYQMESCSNLTTWQLDNLTTWQSDNLTTWQLDNLTFLTIKSHCREMQPWPHTLSYDMWHA